MKQKAYFVIAMLALLLVAACTQKPTQSPTTKKATLFKSQSCGCCSVYSEYLQRQGFEVEIKDMTSLAGVKADFGVPASMQSCHTAKVGRYFVEGHVPVEAIQKLLAENPDIAGIALPGMPSGAPGMPGGKDEPWIIFAVGKDGSFEEFMTM